ncbi:PREDICTED: LOW QUALITY PROTEIN: GDSL esterase/lipase At3g14820-like [Fragaria vesca subsp. vesca]
MALLSQKFCSSSSSVKPLAMILCIFLYRNVAAVTLPTNGTTPAVFAFGDSTLDTGNNDYIISGLKSNFPPYGRDFMGGMPTGRFSNGRVPSDLIAEVFGVKKILPAYLDPNLQLQDLLTGVCFASAGSGYDPLTAEFAELQSVLSLSDQLDLFKEYKSKINTAVGNEKTATLLSKSLFIIWMGSNDLAFSYFATPLRSAHYDIPAYTDFLLEFASTFFQKLYALGARVIGVASMPPIGCVPAQITLGGGIERACSEAENQAAMLYNSKLSALVDSLNKRLPEALVIYIDIYNPFLSIIQDPAQYGFEVVDKGCCGTGIVEFGLLCNKHTPGTCNDASKYMFWDGFHPTETACRILTSEILKQVNKFF